MSSTHITANSGNVIYLPGTEAQVLPFPAQQKAERTVPRWWRPAIIGYIAIILGAMLALRVHSFQGATLGHPLIWYGAIVGLWFFVHGMMAMRYRPVPIPEDARWPHVAVVIPSYNEGPGIATTIRSILNLDYPMSRLRVVVVDDGSTDGSWDLARQAAAGHRNVHLVKMSANRGKRWAMDSGIKQVGVRAQFVLFVDSDTQIEPSSLKHGLAPMLKSEKVAAVTGHAEVANADESALTRIQRAGYFIAFRIIKASESVTGTVICASGCFAVYRRSALEAALPDWINQRFLGAEATFGDDRALTTMLLRSGHKVVYQSTALTSTKVPSTWRAYWRQQLRWKKSWSRESIFLARFAWKFNKFAAFTAYAGIVITLAGPLVLAYCVFLRPIFGDGNPLVYLMGMYGMSLLYGLTYGYARNCANWWKGAPLAVPMAIAMSGQVYWAMWKSKDTAWGTRAASGKASSHSVSVVRGSRIAVRSRSTAVSPLLSWAGERYARHEFVAGLLALVVLTSPLFVFAAFRVSG